jgi:hypothetical protein
MLDAEEMKILSEITGWMGCKRRGDEASDRGRSLAKVPEPKRQPRRRFQ